MRVFITKPAVRSMDDWMMDVLIAKSEMAMRFMRFKLHYGMGVRHYTLAPLRMYHHFALLDGDEEE